VSFAESGHGSHGNLILSQKLYLDSAPSWHRNLFPVSFCYPEGEVTLHHHPPSWAGLFFRAGDTFFFALQPQPSHQSWRGRDTLPKGEHISNKPSRNASAQARREPPPPHVHQSIKESKKGKPGVGWGQRHGMLPWHTRRCWSIRC